ncbi:DNA polymerase III subunit delta [[Mycoplasma] collis]|uniref:DNA polymerase III subunit delta n=1 Tax=[Mycoplasma] collis TaxID=2127 RepID=UPI00051B85EB|nr:hypothetical protein [[Mycoplasma] collis]
MYFLYGDELLLIENELKKILNKYVNYDVIKINSESAIDDFLTKIDNFDLFSNNKIFLIKNSIFFKKSDKKINELIIKNLKLNNIQKNVFVFIYVLTKNEILDKKNTLISFLLNNSISKELSKISDQKIYEYYQKLLIKKKIQINKANSLILFSKLPKDLSFIANEIKKLSLYNKEITENVINNLVFELNIEDDFSFIEAFSKLNFHNIIIKAKNKINNGISKSLLLSQINSFLFVVNTVSLFRDFFSLEEIANKFSIHLFRVKKAHDFLNKYTLNKTQKLIHKIFQIEKDFKSGQISENMAFELFLLNLIIN